MGASCGADMKNDVCATPGGAGKNGEEEEEEKLELPA
jgi:hypothetical protein